MDMNAKQNNSLSTFEQNATPRARSHSACSHLVPRNVTEPSKAASSDALVAQNGPTSNNTFAGLNRRRKISLPSRIPLKPEQFLEGGRVEVKKREVNLDACMPVFTKEAAGSNKKHSTTPLAKTEFNGWMFKDAVNQGSVGRQRRISLPVLRVDTPDSQAFSSNNSVPGGQSAYLLRIPRVQSDSLVGKKAETRQWTQKF